jgi:aspartyl-tRNA(Asn)/glutamyl-tRNA(Gln) amidotransferase subunit C
MTTNPVLDVRYVANLARIDLTDDEVERYQSQLGRVLEYVEQLKRVDVAGVEPTAHASAVFNVFRLDEPRPGLPKDAALSNAPHAANGLVMITKVVE